MEFLSSFSFLELFSVVVTSIVIAGLIGWWIGYAGTHNTFPFREVLTAVVIAVIVAGLIVVNFLIGFEVAERLDPFVLVHVFVSATPGFAVFGALVSGPKMAKAYYN